MNKGDIPKMLPKSPRILLRGRGGLGGGLGSRSSGRESELQSALGTSSSTLLPVSDTPDVRLGLHNGIELSVLNKVKFLKDC